MCDKYVNNYYAPTITLIGAYADEQGRVLKQDGDTPVQVNNKDLVLPLEVQLKNTEWKKRIAFHPLCESTVTNKYSDVFNRFITLSGAALHLRVVEIIDAITTMVSSERTIPPTALTELTTAVGELSKNSILDITAILAKRPQAILKTEDRIISVTLKRNSKYGENKFKAVAEAKCFINEENEDEQFAFGHKCKSKSSARTVKALFNYVLGDLNNLDIYTSTSNGTIAPLWTCYVKTLGLIHSHLNDIIDLFEITGPMIVDTSYMDNSDSIGKLKNLLPILDGNSGNYIDEKVKDVEDENVTSTTTSVKEIPIDRSEGRVPEIARTTGGAFPAMGNSILGSINLSQNNGLARPSGSAFPPAPGGNSFGGGRGNININTGSSFRRPGGSFGSII